MSSSVLNLAVLFEIIAFVSEKTCSQSLDRIRTV